MIEIKKEKQGWCGYLFFAARLLRTEAITRDLLASIHTHLCLVEEALG